MKKNLKRSVAFAMFFAVIVSLGLLSCQSTRAENIAPDFTLNDLDGNSFSLSETKGKVVVLDFWATWCPPCRKEIPDFVLLYKQYGKDGLMIVGVALDRGGAKAVRSFVEQNDVNYPIVLGNQRVSNLYGGISGIPTSFIIDRQGRIANKFVGFRSKEVFENAIKELL